VSWGQIKLVGREPVSAQVLCCASLTDTVLYLARGEEKPSAAQVCQPKLGTGTLAALGRVLFTWLVRLGEEVGALPSDEQPFASSAWGSVGRWPGCGGQVSPRGRVAVRPRVTKGQRCGTRPMLVSSPGQGLGSWKASQQTSVGLNWPLGSLGSFLCAAAFSRAPLVVYYELLNFNPLSKVIMI